jgi:hypothetical protein
MTTPLADCIAIAKTLWPASRLATLPRVSGKLTRISDPEQCSRGQPKIWYVRCRCECSAITLVRVSSWEGFQRPLSCRKCSFARNGRAFTDRGYARARAWAQKQKRGIR